MVVYNDLWYYKGNHDKFLYPSRQQQQCLDYTANSYHPTGSTFGSTITVGLKDYAVYINGHHSPAASLWRHEQPQVFNEAQRTPAITRQRQVITVADNARLTAMVLPYISSI